MIFRRARRALRITRYHRNIHRDVEDELAFHLEMRTEELERTGIPHAEARRLAADALGDLATVRSSCQQLSLQTSRRQHRMDFLSTLRSDLRSGLRQALKQPGASFIILLTWTVCIGANIAIFSLVQSILLRPLPYHQPQDLLSIYSSFPEASAERVDSNLADFVAIRRGTSALESLALYNKVSAGFGPPGAVQNVFCMYVTTAFFEVLGVHPELGSGFSTADSTTGAPPTIVVSREFADDNFGIDSNPVGEMLALEEQQRMIVGVMPKGFLFADWEARLWMPLTIPTNATVQELRASGGYSMVARLGKGRSLVELATELESVDKDVIASLSPEQRQRALDGGYHTRIASLQGDQVRKVRPALYVLWVAVLTVLLIGCINIATMLLVRSANRSQEFATRSALGASKWRLTRQLLTESLLLALLGGGAGVLLGGACLRLLGAFEAYEIPRIGDVSVDLRSLGFALAITTLVGLGAGLAPVATLHRKNRHRGSLREALGNGDRGASKRSGVTLRSGLVVAQLGIAFVLLVGSALMATSLQRILAIDRGFETQHQLAAATVVPWDRYPTLPLRHQFIDQLLEQLRSVPGIEDAAIASQLPFSGIANQQSFVAETINAPSAAAAPYTTLVSPNYFSVLQIPLLDGRMFDALDSSANDPVLIVDELVAQRTWPDRNPVGQRVRLGTNESSPWFTVVGVVETITQNDLIEETPPGALYLPHRDSGITFMRLVLRTSETIVADSLVSAARDALLQIDAESRFFWVLSMDEALAGQLIFRRLPTMLLLSFAGLAFVLSVLGVYGVISHNVGLRRREIGVRIALGGSPQEVTRQVLGQGFRLATLGLAIGIAIALGSTRLLSSVLYGVAPTNPLVFAAVGTVLLIAALLASLLPASRAAKIDPVTTLRA